jgi:hypothetical protein
MRTVPVLLLLWGTGCPNGSRPKTISVRMEPHAKGEVFTVDRVAADGRTTSSSTILYLDGAPRDFEDFGCSGTQTSRRVDGRTMEILRKCSNGEWSRFVLRFAGQPKDMLVEMTEGQPNGGRSEQRLILEGQAQ